MSNKYFPYVFYSTSCDNTPYDILTVNNSDTYDYPMNMGQFATLGKDYGGVAFLGNTRFGYFYSNKSRPNDLSAYLEKVFMNCIKHDSRRLSVSESLSKMPLYSYKLDSSYAHYLRLTHNLIGDPCVDMWTHIPDHYESPNISFNANTFTINNPQIDDDACVSICSLNNSSSYLSNLSSTSFEINHPYVNNVVTIFSKYKLPHIFPLYIQNTNLSLSKYVHCSDLYLGRSVFSHAASGNVNLTRLSNYTFRSYGNCELRDGVRLLPLSNLKIISNKSVKIDGISISNGANLKIECDECEIMNTFIPKGSTLKITKVQK